MIERRPANLARLSALLWILAGIAFVVAGALLQRLQWAFFAVAILFFAIAILMLRGSRRTRD